MLTTVKSWGKLWELIPSFCSFFPWLKVFVWKPLWYSIPAELPELLSVKTSCLSLKTRACQAWWGNISIPLTLAYLHMCLRGQLWGIIASCLTTHVFSAPWLSIHGQKQAWAVRSCEIFSILLLLWKQSIPSWSHRSCCLYSPPASPPFYFPGWMLESACNICVGPSNTRYLASQVVSLSILSQRLLTQKSCNFFKQTPVPSTPENLPKNYMPWPWGIMYGVTP